MEETLKEKFEQVLDENHVPIFGALRNRVINALEAAYNMALPQWVRVEDRLPEKASAVLAFDKITKRIERVWFDPSEPVHFFTEEYSRWMPLPPNPKD